MASDPVAGKGFEGMRLGIADRAVIVFSREGVIRFAGESRLLNQLSFGSWTEFFDQLKQLDEELVADPAALLGNALSGECSVATGFLKRGNLFGALTVRIDPLLSSSKNADQIEDILVALDFVDYFRALATLDELNVNAVLLSEDLVVLDCNDAASGLLACARDSMRGRSFAVDFVGSDEGIIDLVMAFEDVHKSNHSNTLRALELRRDGAAILVCECKLIPINRYLTLGIFVDRTADEYATNELYNARSAEIVHRVAAGSAREFNNLLSIIDGNVRFFASHAGTADATLSEAVTDALSAVESSKKLNERLLRFSSPVANKNESTEVGTYLAEFVEFARKMFPISLLIHLDVTADADFVVNVPEVELETALLALCFNALDAMEYGGQGNVWITLAEHRATDLGMVLIHVEDDGQGMNAEVLERCFEPFFSTRPVGTGNGMGLPAVRDFARQYGGECVADSTEGKGTKVTLRLPVWETTENGLPAHLDGEEREASDARLRGERVVVLLVDDDPRVRKVARRDLTELGMEVIDVECAEKALDVLAETASSIGLIVSDVVMDPGMDGFELRRQVLARFPELPVILISGFANVSGSEDVPYLISKPYQVERLKQVIEECLS